MLIVVKMERIILIVARTADRGLSAALMAQTTPTAVRMVDREITAAPMEQIMPIVARTEEKVNKQTFERKKMLNYLNGHYRSILLHKWSEQSKLSTSNKTSTYPTAYECPHLSPTC